MEKTDWKRIADQLGNAKLHHKSDKPTHWEISENEDGWMIVFSGAINGAIHPKSFCQLIIEELNGGS